MSTIVNTLGAGSGIDTEALVTKLVAAQREAADKALATRKTDNDARISAMGQVTSALGAFSTALSGLVSGGTLSAQATSSDPSAVGASFTGASRALASTIEVRSLATAQTLSSTPVTDRTAPVGQGTLTFTLGTLAASASTPTGFTAGPGSFTVTVGPNDDSLDGLAAAINAAKGGVTATVVTDAAGSRLVLKGPTGTAQGFTVSADPALSQFAFGPGVSSAQSLAATAADAQLVLDGVAVHTATNSITDLLPGVKLDLRKEAVGTKIALTSTRDTSALTQAVGDYVSAYNEVASLLATLTRPATSTDVAGALKSESSVRELQRRLNDLTSTRLLTGGAGVSTLAEIGVKTNRDGTLAVDSAALAKAVAADPDRIEALFTAAQSTTSPKVAVASAQGAVRSGAYALTDIAPATAGTLAVVASPTAFAAPVVIDAGNHIIRMSVDGRSSLDVAIPDGSYADGASLAAAIQAAVNADASLAAFGKALTATWTGSGFAFASRALGSTTAVSLDSVDAGLSATLGLGAQTAANGTDAAARIDGKPMTGFGDRLVAPVGSAAVGLVLQVSAGAPATATVNVTGGIAGLLANIYTDLSTGSGPLAGALTRLNTEKTAIADDATALDTRSSAYKDQLTTQFAAMEKAVAAFKSTQDFLKQQIDAWNAAKDN